MTYSLSQSVVCLSYFQAKPEFREELIKALQELIKPTRNESGCLQYELIIDQKDPNFLIMLEKFVDLPSLDEHEKQPYVKAFVEQYMPIYCEKVYWHVGREIT